MSELGFDLLVTLIIGFLFGVIFIVFVLCLVTIKREHNEDKVKERELLKAKYPFKRGDFVRLLDDYNQKHIVYDVDDNCEILRIVRVQQEFREENSRIVHANSVALADAFEIKFENGQTFKFNNGFWERVVKEEKKWVD